MLLRVEHTTRWSPDDLIHYYHYRRSGSRSIPYSGVNHKAPVKMCRVASKGVVWCYMVSLDPYWHHHDGCQLLASHYPFLQRRRYFDVRVRVLPLTPKWIKTLRQVLLLITLKWIQWGQTAPFDAEIGQTSPFSKQLQSLSKLTTQHYIFASILVLYIVLTFHKWGLTNKWQI